jgi:hypothetical protein
MADDGLIVDVGGNPDRHAQLGRLDVWSLCPVLDAKDVVRAAERKAAMGTNWCRHQFPNCDCHEFSAIMFVHSIYDISPLDVAVGLHKTRRRRAIVVAHRFDNAYGSFPYNEASYAYVGADRVTMTTRAGYDRDDSTYVHGAANWLRSGYYSSGEIAMAWKMVFVMGSTFVYSFTVAPVGMDALPRPLSFSDAVGNYGAVGTVDLDPTRKAVMNEASRFTPGTEFLKLAPGSLFSAGPQFVLSTDEKTAIPVPKGIIASVANQLAMRPRGPDTVNLARQHVQRELSAMNMTPERKNQALPWCVAFGLVASIEAEAAAMKSVVQPYASPWYSFLPWYTSPIATHAATLRLEFPTFLHRFVNSGIARVLAVIGIASVVGLAARYGGSRGVKRMAAVVFAASLACVFRVKPTPGTVVRNISTDVCVGDRDVPIQDDAKIIVRHNEACVPRFGNEPVGPHPSFVPPPVVARTCSHNIATALKTRMLCPAPNGPDERATAASALWCTYSLTDLFGSLVTVTRVKPTPFDAWVSRDTISPARRAAFIVAKERLRAREVAAAERGKSITRFFDKRENQLESGELGIVAFKPRLICPREDEMVVETGPFYHACGKRLAHVCRPGKALVYASGMTSDVLGAWFDDSWNTVIEAMAFDKDAANYDGTQYMETLVFHDLVDTRYGISARTRAATLAKLHTRGASLTGVSASWEAKVKSGDTSTSYHNSSTDLASAATQAIFATDPCNCPRQVPSAFIAAAVAQYNARLAELGVKSVASVDPRWWWCDSHNPFAMNLIRVACLGDDMVAVVSRRIMARYRPMDIDRELGWKVEVNVNADPDFASFCSARFVPATVDGDATRILTPSVGRVLRKTFFARQPVPLRIGVDRPIDSQARLAREVYCRGIALGLDRDSRHAPVLRAIVANILRRTARHGDVPIIKPNFSVRSAVFATDNDDTWATFENVYGVSPSEARDCEDYILSQDVFAGLDHPVLRRVVEIDAPDKTLVKPVLDVLDGSWLKCGSFPFWLLPVLSFVGYMFSVDSTGAPRLSRLLDAVSRRGDIVTTAIADRLARIFWTRGLLADDTITALSVVSHVVIVAPIIEEILNDCLLSPRVL